MHKNCNTLQKCSVRWKKFAGGCSCRPSPKISSVVSSGWPFGPSPDCHSVRSYLVSFDDVDVKRSDGVTSISVACEVDRL